MHFKPLCRLAIIAAVSFLLAQPDMAGEVLRLRVTGDNVNIRAKSSPNAEVVGQVISGDILDGFATSSEWFQVVLPSNISCWVAAEFVNNGVARTRVNVRSGPGLNFSSLGLIHFGTVLEIREHKDPWLRIAPPSGISGWISSRFVVPVTQPPPISTAPLPLPPADVTPQLQPQVVQGQTTSGWEGIVTTGKLFSREPSKYRLINKGKAGSSVVCYLRGNKEQLESFKGRAVRIQGREYWLKAATVPLVVPETITPLE